MCTISNLKCWNCNNHRIITPRNDDRGATNQQIKLARAHCSNIIFEGRLFLHFNETCLKNLSYDSIKSDKKHYFVNVCIKILLEMKFHSIVKNLLEEFQFQSQYIIDFFNCYLQDPDFLTFPAYFWIPIFFSNLNFNCSNLLDMRNLQGQVKKVFCYLKLTLLLFE